MKITAVKGVLKRGKLSREFSCFVVSKGFDLAYNLSEIQKWKNPGYRVMYWEIIGEIRNDNQDAI